MYDKIMNAAQIIALEMEALHNRTVRLETELDKERIKKERLKQDLYAALERYSQED